MEGANSSKRPASLNESVKRRINNFNPEWELVYMVRCHGGDSQCLICHRHVTCRSFNVKRHYESIHSAKYGQYEGVDRKALYLSLLAKLEAVPETKSEHCSLGAVRVSYEVALQLARANHTFPDGDFVKACILKAVDILSPELLPTYESICLSPWTIERCVHEMADDCEYQLKQRINSFVAVSLAIDECRDISDNIQLVVFIRGVDNELNITEEFLDLIPTKGVIDGENILKCVDDCVRRMELSWSKIVSVATNGSKSMLDFIARLRKKIELEDLRPDFVAVHYLVHQEALYADALQLENVMSTVVKCVNLLRRHALGQPEFNDLLEFVRNEHVGIPYYTEVRWISRGFTLRRFFELRKLIYGFLEQKQEIFPELINADWVTDLGFMADITEHLNTLNVALFDPHKLVYQMNDAVEGFKKKLHLWRRQLNEKNFDFFPCLALLATDKLDIEKYVQKLLALEYEFSKRFAELLPLQTKFEIFAAPFAVDACNATHELQMEIIDLQCDTRLKAEYKDSETVVEFYKSICVVKYSNLLTFAANIIAMFGSTYFFKQFFTTIKLNRIRLRNFGDNNMGSVMDSNMASAVRLATARELVPNIDALISSKMMYF